MKQRLDKSLVRLGETETRSQAENYIRLGRVKVNGQIAVKPGHMVNRDDKIIIDNRSKYVSRAAFKLKTAADKFNLDFNGKTVLDVGSSTGGFTDFALQNGAKKVIAVDVGSYQMHPRLRQNKRVDLYEKTDIRNICLRQTVESNKQQVKSNNKNNSHATCYVLLAAAPDVILVDVSFISLREILPHVTTLMNEQSELIAMVKPQFETGGPKHKNKGIIKNENIRRQILADFELWAKSRYRIVAKADTDVSGAKGNKERFYKLALLPNWRAGSI